MPSPKNHDAPNTNKHTHKQIMSINEDESREIKKKKSAHIVNLKWSEELKKKMPTKKVHRVE